MISAHSSTRNNIKEQSALAVDASVVSTFETVVTHYNATADAIRTVGVYISCLVSTDSRNDLAQAKMSETTSISSPLFTTQYTLQRMAWFA